MSGVYLVPRTGLRANQYRSSSLLLSVRASRTKQHLQRPRTSYRLASSLSDAAPRIAQPSFWKSLIPKPLRRNSSPSTPHSNKPQQQQQQRKDWNPFVVYMVMFMLIGSNAINLIGLRNELVNFSQKTDRQISLLKEVIRKIQNGEKVDIEEALGTGDPEKEKDWEEGKSRRGVWYPLVPPAYQFVCSTARNRVLGCLVQQ